MLLILAQWNNDKNSEQITFPLKQKNLDFAENTENALKKLISQNVFRIFQKKPSSYRIFWLNAPYTQVLSYKASTGSSKW